MGASGTGTETKLLRIMTSDGQLWEKQFQSSTKTESVKKLALAHFNSENSDYEPFEFRLIHPTDFRIMADHHSLEEERLKDNETLLLIQERNIIVHEVVPENELKAPTKDQILEATKNIPPSPSLAQVGTSPGSTAARTPPGVTAESAKDLVMLLHNEATHPTSDFQVDLRKILISLISLMTEMLQGDPDIVQICKEFQAKLQKRVTKALEHKNITPETSKLQSSPNSSSQDQAFQISSTPMGLIEGLIKLKKLEFHPDEKAIEGLKEMGFNEYEIIDALRLNKNKQEKATEWLLNTDRINTEDITTGLDPHCHLYKAITENPVIRLGLSTPKSLLAFFGIIDTSESASFWMSDPETSNVITTVFRVYHAEKHNVDDNTSAISNPGPSSSSGGTSSGQHSSAAASRTPG